MIPEIAGLRAVAVLWMIGFHVVFCIGFHVPAVEYRELLTNPLLAVFSQGHLAVDSFFVISGYLITFALSKELAINGRIQIARFYYRRWMRIVPAYTVVTLLSYPILGKESNIQNSWANLLFINNFLPLQQQAVPWSWSIAIECQFYALAPWLVLGWHLLRPHGPGGIRLRRASYWTWLVPLLILGTTCTIRGGLASLTPELGHWLAGSARIGWLHMPYLFHPEFDWVCFHDYFNMIYDKPYGRCAPLLLGAYIVHLERQPAVMHWVAGQSIGSRLARAIFALMVPFSVWLSGDITCNRGGNGWRALINLACYRVLFSAAVAYLFLYIIACRNCAQDSRLSRFLSWSRWQPVAALSYSAYLIHLLIVLTLWSLLAARSAQHGAAVWFWVLPLTYGLTFLSAALLYSLVEKPLRSFSRRKQGRLAGASD